MKRLAPLFFLACAAVPAQELLCNTPITGYLQPPNVVVIDPLNTRPTTLVYPFSAVAGESVMLRLELVNPEATFKPRLTVHGPSASEVKGRTTYGSLGTYFASEYAITDSGTHTVEIAATSVTPGSFRLVLIRLNRPCVNATLTCGAPASASISGSLDMRVYKFDAAANDTLSFRFVKTGPFTPATGTGGPPVVPPPTNIVLLVYGPDGLLVNTVRGDPAALQQSGRNRLQVDVQTPLAGPVTAVLFDANDNAAQFSLSASRLNGACGDKQLGCGSVVDAGIAAVIQIDGYHVTAQAGDVFAVKLARADTSGKFLPVAEVYDPAGKLVSNLGSASSGSHAVVQGTFRADAAGRYTILVGDGADATQTGAYTVVLNRLNRPCSTGPAIGCATVLDASISGMLRQNTYTISASANDAFLLRLLRTGANASFKPRMDIYDAQGNIVQTTSTSDLARVNATVPATGDYSVIVSDSFDGAQSGSYTLSAVRLNRPCNAGVVECGKVAAGSIDGPLRSSTFQYTANPGDSFTVRLLNPGGGLQPDIEIYDPQGQKVGTDISGNVKGFDVARPSGGVYTVLALDSSKTPGQGAFSLELLRTRNACGSSPQQGQTVSGIVSGAAPFVAYSFPVGGGDQLNIRSTSFTPGFTSIMELYDGDGVRVDSGTYSVSRRAAAAGTYTAVVSASNPRTAGSYAFAWQLLNNPANAPSLVCGSTASGSLSAGSEFRYYLAGLNNNDVAKILLTPVSGNFTPQMEIYDPNGGRLGSGTGEVQQRVRADGNYLVLVSPSTANGETGSYSLAFQRPNNPCSAAALACGQSVLRTADLPGQIDGFTFSGNAGALTTLRLPARSGTFAPFAELFDSGGTLVRGSSTGTLSVTLPATGTYAVLVRDRNGSGTGSYRASLQTDPACTVDDKQAPGVFMLRPTGGEVAAGGSPFRIAWQSDDNVDVASQEIRLSTDGGKTFPTMIAGGLNGATQSFDWNVPSNVAPTRTAVIRVTAVDAAGNSQSADGGPLALIGSGFTENTSITLTYDSMNRITSVSYSDGRSVQYTYDAAGNLLQVSVSGQ